MPSRLMEGIHLPSEGRGHIGASGQRLFKTLGIRGAKLKRAIREIAEEAQQGSFWPRLPRNDRIWGRQGS